MSKTDTINALTDSAIQHFAKHGYEGASLRDIARDADVPLSTIHLYFGSKSELFDAVRLSAWEQLIAERAALLEASFERSNGAPTLEDVVHALAYPVARRALSDTPRDTAEIFLLRGHWHERVDDEMMTMADRLMTPFLNVILQNQPSLSRGDAGWILSYIIGVIYSWQLIDHRYDKLIGEEPRRSAISVTADIAAFCRGGIEALVARRAQAEANAPTHVS